ncbi:MAG: ribonuclease III [Candidatus Kapaibacterium sp.]|nr:ribonuclease III [Ignavibacteriota bacterium]MCB9220795.1 ribonuclease III [Ignavibacteria bacterium]
MRSKLNRLISSIFSDDKNLKKSNFERFFVEVGFFSKEQKKSIEEKIGVKINNFAFFEQALTHRSYLQISEQKIYSNERLEFFGDSILGMIVAEYLFLEHDVLEGDLTKMRSSIVNKQSLAYCAEKLGLDKFILLSFSAQKALQNGSNSLLADCVEAIIGAIYLDSGLENARYFITKKFIPLLNDNEFEYEKNFKSKLLELIQSQGKEAPTYKVLSEEGPDHMKKFEVGVYSENDLIGSGIGKNKKSAEQKAAKSALKQLKI